MEERILELLLMGSSKKSVTSLLAEHETNNNYFIDTFPTGDPIAVVAYRLVGGIVEILDIVVAPEHRGQGVGSFLINRIIANCSPKKILAETDDDAVGFYRKLGFNIIPFESKWGITRYKMDLTCEISTQ